MDEPLYIEKDQPLKEGLNYHALLKEGVQYIQEMCGGVWTDYNEHDPGVTMLEQLCYALTSLSYLTEIPISDLLIDKAAGRIDTQRQALFLPKNIYPCNPLTADDYRKLLLDRLLWAGNAWLVPVPIPANSMGVAGLYKVLLYIPEPAARATATEQTRKLYAAHRNLCEDIHSVHILKNSPLQLYADVAFNDRVTPESLLAQLFLAVNQYMAPEIERYSLEKMSSQGLAADDIFEGPLLHNGFIEGNDLQPKATTLYVNQIEKAMLGITGVENIRNVYLKNQDGEYPQKIGVPEDTIMMADTRPLPDKTFTIRFYKKGIEYKPDPTRVQKELSRLYQQLRLRYKLDQQYENFFGIPTGQYKPVENYYSIQNQFPIVYGINRFGLLKSDTPERKAQAKQLKAYLLVFEQLMADFQSQLAHTKDLFSIDPTLRHTYFYQGLENIVPNIQPILKKGDDDHSCNGYKKGLKKLINSMDPYTDRRNRFLDFLLALYGEAIPEYAISPYNDCGPELSPAERLIKAKLRFLELLVISTHDRSRGFNYMHRYYEANIPGMEWKIRVLLGMQTHPLQYASEAAQNLGWKLVNTLPAGPAPAHPVNDHYETIEIAEGPGQYNAAAQQALLKTITWYKEGLVDEAFITSGAQLHGYRIGEDKNTRSWELVFRATETEPWKTLGKFNSRDDASAAACALVASLKTLCCCFNRLYIIENNLLRYALQQDDNAFALPGCGGRQKDDIYSFHYSFHISVVFSGCRHLIDNMEYRRFAEETVAGNTPAHIAARYHWLSPWQLLLFELVYQPWRLAIETADKNPGLLAALSKDMILFFDTYANTPQP